MVGPSKLSTELDYAILYLRPLGPHGVSETQRELIDRLEKICTEGIVKTFDTEVWGARIPKPSARADGIASHEAAHEILAWANSSGRSLRAFTQQQTRSFVDDEEHEVICPPMMCLALYEDDELVVVYPHTEKNTHHTIFDGVDLLERVVS